MNVGTLTAILRLKDENFRKGLEQAGQRIKKTGDSMIATGKKLSMRITAPFVAFSAASIKAASDAEETASKFNVVFGPAADRSREAIQRLAETIPLTVSQMQAMGAGIQDMLVPMGVAREDAAGMSVDMIALAGDMASFNNVGTDEVLMAMQSALAGSSEPMRRFGVDTRETALKTLALNKGLIQEGEELDNTTRALAVMAAIQKDSTDSIGDAERTVGSTANQFKFLARDVRQLAEDIGKILIPIIKPMLARITEWVKRLREASPAQKKMALAIGAIAAAVGPLLVVFGTLASSIGSIMMLFGGAAAGGGLIATLGTVVTFLTGPVGIVIAVGVMIAAWKPARDLFVTLIKILVDLVKIALMPVVGAFKLLRAAAQPLIQLFTTLASAVKDVFGSALTWMTDKLGVVSGWLGKLTGTELPELEEAQIEVAAATVEVATAIAAQAIELEAVTVATHETVAVVEDLVAAYVPLNRAQLNAALTARSLAEEQKRLDAEMDNIIASTLEWEGILPTVTGEQLLAAAATEEVKDAVMSLTDETKATTNAWADLGDILATGVGWFDQITQGVMSLVSSLLNKKDGLTGALTGIGGIVSGLFGSGLGGGSNVGQMAGGILSKLGSSGILSGLFGGGAAAAGGAGLFSAAGMAGSFSAAGGMAGIMGGGAAMAGMGPIMAAITGPYGMAAMALLSAFGPQIKDGLKKLGGFVKSLFGVDQSELDARKIKGSITDLINNVMDAQQKAEAGNEQWRKSNVVVRDAYLTIGASIQEAEAQQALLASASKKSPAEAQRIVDSIKAVIEQVQAQMAETNLSMTQLRDRNISAAKASAAAAAKAMSDTVVATKSAAAAASDATKKAMTDTVAVAQVASKKVSEAFTASMTAVKNVATETAAKVTEKFQAIDVSSPIDRFTDRLSETLGGGGDNGMAAAGAGGGGVVFQDQNAARLEALMERLPTIMERAVQHGLQTSGRKARN